MAELLSTESITVTGGPSAISVDLDFGPSGQRGSQIFIRSGNPNSLSWSSPSWNEPPIIYDICINNQSGDDYQSFYQYQNVLGTNSWVKIFNLQPNQYSQNVSALFTAGHSNILLPVASMVTEIQTSILEVANINVQVSVVNPDGPTAISVSDIQIIEDSGIYVLSIDLEAAAFVSQSWEALSGQKTVHLFISVV